MPWPLLVTLFSSTTKTDIAFWTKCQKNRSICHLLTQMNKWIPYRTTIQYDSEIPFTLPHFFKFSRWKCEVTILFSSLFPCFQHISQNRRFLVRSRTFQFSLSQTSELSSQKFSSENVTPFLCLSLAPSILAPYTGGQASRKIKFTVNTQIWIA